jgi:hypothetical protein
MITRGVGNLEGLAGMGRAGKAHVAVAVVPLLLLRCRTGEHPTQAMLDLLTIHLELGCAAGRTVTLVGDLKNGRTVHSLVKLLCLFEGVKLIYVSPRECTGSGRRANGRVGRSAHPRARWVLVRGGGWLWLSWGRHVSTSGCVACVAASLAIPEDVRAYAASHGLQQREAGALDEEVMRQTDVLYVTRVQKERFESEAEYIAVKDLYILTADTLAKVRGQMAAGRGAGGRCTDQVGGCSRGVCVRLHETSQSTSILCPWAAEAGSFSSHNRFNQIALLTLPPLCGRRGAT